MMSSMSSLFIFVVFIRSLITCDKISSGLIVASNPLLAIVNGDLLNPTITAFIKNPLKSEFLCLFPEVFCLHLNQED